MIWVQSIGRIRNHDIFAGLIGHPKAPERIKRTGAFCFNIEEKELKR